MRSLKRLICGTNNAILALGGLASAGLAVYGVVQVVAPSGGNPGPPPAASIAKFAEAKVEPYVLLAQYETLNQPGALGNASDGSPRRPSGYRLVADTAPASPRAAISIAVDVSQSANVTGASSSASSSGPEASLSAQGGGEGGTGATGSVGPAGETGPTGVQESQREAERREREEKIKAQDEAEKKAREEAKVAAEKRMEKARQAREAEEEREEERELRAEERKLRAGKGAGTPPGYTKFVPPPPSPTPFHREGDAQVIVGTGAPKSKIDAVLGKVKAILAEEGLNPSATDADLGESRSGLDTTDAGFVQGDSVFSETTTAQAGTTEGPSGETGAPLATRTRCGASCALTPLIDHAISDYSSNLAEAAKEIAAIFTGTRYQKFEHKRQPIGVTVEYKIDFRGYAGKAVSLVWVLCNQQGDPLPKTWWRNVIVKQIKPSGYEVPVTGNFWAPIPRRQGDYHFKLRLFTGNHEDEHAATGAFR